MVLQERYRQGLGAFGGRDRTRPWGSEEVADLGSR